MGINIIEPAQTQVIKMPFVKYCLWIAGADYGRLRPKEEHKKTVKTL
jgi:hypothetical protein